MNANDIKLFLEANYSESKQTLRDTSYDSDNKEYVCESIKEAFNYDKIIRIIYSGRNNPETPDAIFFSDKINFIEFKNGTINGKDKLRLKIKALEGVFNFCKHILQSFDADIDRTLRYIVVYNVDKNQSDEQKNSIKSHLFKKAKTKYVRFGLERFEGAYFSEVFTYSKEEFKSEFLNEVV